jgi:glycosyl-4,4'-diaponeurosporenoate acyltransferase
MTTVATPLGELSGAVVVGANVIAWLVWVLAVGYVAHVQPLSRVDHDTWLTRARRFEDGGRWYEQVLHIKAWKDLLPEGGSFFKGGFAKRSVAGGDVDVMQRFVAETRRAEYAHWVMMLGGLLFVPWNPWWADVFNVLLGIAINAPCLLVQRYNRLRLTRVLTRRGVRGVS